MAPTENTNKRGILLLALGHPQYGRMAANWASAIFHNDRDMPIHLVYSGNALSHLTPYHLALFSSFAECPEEYYTTSNKPDYFKAKTHLFDLSPFEETLYLDCDLILFSKSKPGVVMEQMSRDGDFDIQSRGYTNLRSLKTYGNYTHWCNAADVKRVYGINKGRFYQLSSELVFFKKTSRVETFFESVKGFYKDPKVPSPEFAGAVSDELAYNLAALQHGMGPVEAGRVFMFWHLMEKTTKPRYKSFLGYSAGGNNATEGVCHFYNDLCRYYAAALQLPMAYLLQPKRHWSPERRSM